MLTLIFLLILAILVYGVYSFGNWTPMRFVVTTLSIILLLTCSAGGLIYWKSLKAKQVKYVQPFQDNSIDTSEGFVLTPEPSTVIALVTGLGSLWVFKRKIVTKKG